MLRRTVLVLTVAAIVAVLVSGPVAAQAEGERVEIGPAPFVLTTANPCNGETVLVTGEMKGFFQEQVSPSGETSFKFHLEMHGTGVGSQGNMYVFEQTEDFESKDGPPITHTSSIVLVNQGSGDNYTLIFVIQILPNGDVHFRQADAICRG